MSKHADDDPVMFTYFPNITFKGSEESGYTWGDWRQMTEEDRNEIVQEFINELVTVGIKDDE